ncbi:MAG: ribosome small subunit-dependent GTPase A [Chloroflexi bacterium]|nr:MAG: ribosome small subunit-dependent GTPase A [Chloroflexota bacterium]
MLRSRSGFYTVTTESGTYECQLRGRLKRERQSEDLVVPGDEVTLTPLAGAEANAANGDASGTGQGVIEAVAPRRTRFSRRQPGNRGTWKEDLLVANLDQLLVVFACADPVPHVRMIDRFLVIAEHNGVEAVVVANKIDLCGMDVARATFDLYERIGYQVLYASAHTGEGVDALRNRLAGRISLLTGPSGVGKSTLLNVVQPGLHLATGEISSALHKGRHTTTLSELLPVEGPGGGYVVDSPGLRQIGLWDIPAEEIAWCYPDLRPYLGECRFADCSHGPEPGCAIIAAAAAGTISPTRVDSYRRLVASS